MLFEALMTHRHCFSADSEAVARHSLFSHSTEQGHPAIPHAASCETFSPNAIGVEAINASPTFAPTPMALGLNVKPLIRDRVRYMPLGGPACFKPGAAGPRNIGLTFNRGAPLRSKSMVALKFLVLRTQLEASWATPRWNRTEASPQPIA